MLTNDPEITARLRAVFTELLGRENVHDRKPMMGGEDFSRYAMTGEKVPVCLFWVGATPAAKLAESGKSGEPVPSLHSPFFHPDADVSLPVGVSAMSSAVLELMRR